MKIPVIETERLTMREFREEDFERFAEMKGDPEVMQYIADGRPLSREVAWRLMSSEIGHWDLLGFGHWAVVERSSGLFMGAIGLNEPLGWPGLEAGWQLHRSAWGKGYATEGALASLNFAWRQLGANGVLSMIQRENFASIRVAEKIGETLKGELNFHGHNVLLYAMDRPEPKFSEMMRVFRGWKSKRRWREWQDKNKIQLQDTEVSKYGSQFRPIDEDILASDDTSPKISSSKLDTRPEIETARQMRPFLRRLFNLD